MDGKQFPFTIHHLPFTNLFSNFSGPARVKRGCAGGISAQPSGGFKSSSLTKLTNVRGDVYTDFGRNGSSSPASGKS
jgi:hypothetical protein